MFHYSMPNPKKLAVGDSIRILSVPKADILKREAEKRPEKVGDLLPTATVLEKIIEICPVVIIDHIDEYETPWFSVRLHIKKELQHHTIAVMDDTSWELVSSGKNPKPPKEHVLATLKKKADDILEKYEEEYFLLAEKSEKLYDERKVLEKEYKKLERKTGLQAVHERIAQLMEEDKK